MAAPDTLCRPATHLAPQPAPTTLAELGAASDAHLRTCLWCYRFYRRGLQAEGWQLTDAAAWAPPGVCPLCEQHDEMLALLLKRDRDDRDERLVLTVCRACGHAEPQQDAAA